MLIVVLGLMVAGVSWWLTGRLAARKALAHSLDHPNERSLHVRPTPRTGGLAIIASALVGLGMAAIVTALQPPPGGFLPKGLASGSLWIVGSIVAITIVSFFDDRHDIPPGVRFIVQVMAALVIVCGVGLTLPSIPIPGVKTIPLSWMMVPVSVVFLIWMTNLYNFMDGMDGFAGGMTVLGFGFLAFFGWKVGHTFMWLIATLISMSALGFLVHNFPPARIFMGDVGSTSLGFTGGTLILLGVRDGIFDVWVPIFIFSPFILDATATLVRRAVRLERVWEAHREHFYQRLVLSGWGHRKTTLAEYGIMTLCGVLAVVYHHATDAWKFGLLIVWCGMFVLFGHAVREVEQQGSRTEG